MSIEPVAALSSDQARADAASLRLAAALALEQADPTTSPADIARGQVEVASARAELARADAAVRADEAASSASASSSAASPATPTGGHIVEVVV